MVSNIYLVAQFPFHVEPSPPFHLSNEGQSITALSVHLIMGARKAVPIFSDMFKHLNLHIR